jgi:response regulator RpfG family c-di-GMP phosphodiesterase
MNAPLPAQSEQPRVLVVEDEPALRRGVCRLAQGAGYRVLEADSLSAAREQLASGDVDVLVLDIGLPDGSGLALMSHEPASARVPTLVFTSSRERSDLQSALDLGAVAFLSKSTDDLTLSAQIAIAVRQAKGRRAAAHERQRLETSLADMVSRWDGLPRGLAQGFCSAWDLRHIETGAHVRRIGAYSEVLSLALGASPSEAAMLGEVAVLHDIGKIAIPDNILCKPGPLTPAELAIMQQHPIEGAKLLRAGAHPFLDHAALVARWHHERWDGSGYPDGLRGTKIPLGSRIVLACDAYCAMVAPRPYRPALSEREAIAELRRRAGTQFDPQVVTALLDVLGVESSL